MSPRTNRETLVARLHAIKVAYFIEETIDRDEYLRLVDEWWHLMEVNKYVKRQRALRRHSAYIRAMG